MSINTNDIPNGYDDSGRPIWDGMKYGHLGRAVLATWRPPVTVLKSPNGTCMMNWYEGRNNTITQYLLPEGFVLELAERGIIELKYVATV